MFAAAEFKPHERRSAMTPRNLAVLILSLCAAFSSGHAATYDATALARLLDLAKSESAADRLQAARALTSPSFPQQEAAAALLALLRDRQSFIRLAAVESLQFRDDPATVKVLAHALEIESDETVKEQLRQAVTVMKVGPAYVMYEMQDTDPAARAEGAKLARPYDFADIQAALVRLLSDRDHPEVQRAAAITLLERKDPAVVGYEIEVLESGKTAQERIYAAISLGDLRARSAVDPLIKALAGSRGGDGGLAPAAASALGKIGDPRAAQPMIDAFPSESDWYSWSQSLHELGDSAIGPLLRTAGSTDPVKRTLAIRTFGMFADDRSFNALTNALRDPVDELRGYAAIALADRKDARAVPAMTAALQAHLGGRSEEVLVRALSRLDSRSTAPTLIRELKQPIAFGESSAILDALGDVGGDDALQTLILFLDGKLNPPWKIDNYHLELAAGALTKFNDARAEAALYRLLENRQFAAARFTPTVKYYIAHGRDGSDVLLAQMLDSGDRFLWQVASLYLASGNRILIDSANKWAKQTGSNVVAETNNPVKWKGNAPSSLP